MSERDCEICKGYRLNEKALTVKINDCHIGKITKKPITQCLKWFVELESRLNKNELKISEGIIKEIKDRLVFLN